MIVTIDGPAGAGKSTIAKELAQQLGFRFLDTGAMYGAAVVAAMKASIDWEDSDRLVELIRSTSIGFHDGRVMIDGEDVEDQIRVSSPPT